MRFARGTKVRIRYTAPTGRKAWVMRWWHQVNTLVEKYAAAGCTDFEVKGYGWKAWRRYPLPQRQTSDPESVNGGTE